MDLPTTLLDPVTEDDVQALFQSMLGRSTTQEHVESFLEQGSTLGDVMNVILHSGELCRVLNERHPAQNSIERPASPDDIRRVFRCMLGREIGPEHLQSLVDGGSGLLDVVGIVIASRELLTGLLDRHGLDVVAAVSDNETTVSSDWPMEAAKPGEASHGVASDPAHAGHDRLDAVRVQVTARGVPRDDAGLFAGCVALLGSGAEFDTAPASARLEASAEGGTLVALWLNEADAGAAPVGVVVVDSDTVARVVLDSRALGQGVEGAALAAGQALIASAGFAQMRGVVFDTPANGIARSIFRQFGFRQETPGVWTRGSAEPIVLPSHVRLSGP